MCNRDIFSPDGTYLGWQTLDGHFYDIHRDRIGFKRGDAYYTLDGEVVAYQRDDTFYGPDGHRLDWIGEAGFFAAVTEELVR